MEDKERKNEKSENAPQHTCKSVCKQLVIFSPFALSHLNMRCLTGYNMGFVEHARSLDFIHAHNCCANYNFNPIFFVLFSVAAETTENKEKERKI